MKTNLQELTAPTVRKSSIKSRWLSVLCLIAAFWLGSMVQVNAQDITARPYNGFEDSAADITNYSWQVSLGTANVVSNSDDVRTGQYAAEFVMSLSSGAAGANKNFKPYVVSNLGQSIGANQRLHFIAWVKQASKSTNVAAGATSTAKMFGIASQSASSSGAGSYVTADARFSSSYTRYSTYWSSAGAKTVYLKLFNYATISNITFNGAGTYSESIFMDDVIIYTSGNTETDLKFDEAPKGATTQPNGTSLSFTNGSDSNTGIQATQLWKRTGAVADLDLNDQGVYSTTGGATGPKFDQSGQWTLVKEDTSISKVNGAANSIAYTVNVGETYAIVQRDLAYNYSDPLVITIASACDAALGSIGSIATVCSTAANVTVNITASAMGASGNTVSYKIGSGTVATTALNGSGGNYSFTVPMTALSSGANTLTITALYNGDCTTSVSSNNTTTITVDAAPSAGEIINTGSGTILITGSTQLELNGGSGAILWQISDDNGATWAAAGGINDENIYTVQYLTPGNYLFRVQRSNGVCAPVNTPSGEEIALTVNAITDPIVMPDANNIDPLVVKHGESVSLAFTYDNAGGNMPSFYWVWDEEGTTPSWVEENIVPIDTESGTITITGTAVNTGTTPISYTYYIGLEDAEDVSGVITVNPLSSNNNIKTFTLNGKTGTISGTNITVTLDAGAAKTGTPVIVLEDSEFASIITSPLPTDYSCPVSITVKAENGDEKEYTVTVNNATATATTVALSIAASGSFPFANTEGDIYIGGSATSISAQTGCYNGRRAQQGYSIIKLVATSASKIVVWGNSSGATSSRALSEIAICDTETGEYTVIDSKTYTTSSEIVNNSDCKAITISGLNIPTGKYVKITYDGNVRVFGFDITSVVPSIVPKKDKEIVSSTTATCTAGEDVYITLKAAECGVTYVLDGKEETGAGADITWKVNPEATTTYAIKTKAANGYSAVDMDTKVTVTVSTPLAFTGAITSSTGSTAICEGTTTTLTAPTPTGTNALVTWYAGAGATGDNLGTGTTLENVGEGTYYAYATATCGDPIELSISIIEDKAPVKGSISGGITLCGVDTTMELTLEDTEGSIQWQELVGEIWTDIEDATNEIYEASIAVAGTTKYRAVISSGVCEAAISDELTVAVYATPEATIYSGNQEEQNIPGLKFQLEANDPAQIQSTATGLWTSDNGGTFDDATKFDAVFTPAGVKTYTLTWTVSNNNEVCSPESDFISITVNEASAPYITTAPGSGDKDQTLTFGQSIEEIILEWGFADDIDVTELETAGLIIDKDTENKTVSISGYPATVGVHSYDVTTEGDNAATITITITVKLPAPLASAATDRTAEGFTANWTKVADADHYTVTVFENDGITEIATEFTADGDGEVESIVISGLDPKTTYKYSVVAEGVDAAINSAASNQISVTTLSNDNVFTSFTIKGVAATIDNTANTLTVTLPYGTTLPANLAVDYATSAGVQSVTPSKGTISVDDQMTFTVKAESGLERVYTLNADVVQTQPKVAFLYTSATCNAPSYNAIKDLYKVDVFDIRAATVANGDTATFIANLKNNYDLVILHEAVGSGEPVASRLGNYIGKMPILNTKAHMHGKTNWPAGGANNGVVGNTDASVNSCYVSHPIFVGLTINASNAIQLGNASGNIRYATGTPTGIIKIATNPGKAEGNGTPSTDNYVIGEDNRGAYKYLLISISAAAESLNDNGVRLFQNACNYLISDAIYNTNADNAITSLGLAAAEGITAQPTITPTAVTIGSTAYEVVYPVGAYEGKAKTVPTITPTINCGGATLGAITQASEFDTEGIDNVASFTVTAANAEEKSYTVTMKRLLSEDATLSALTVGGVAVPNFNSNTKDYVVTMPYGEAYPTTISGTTTYADATITAENPATGFGDDAKATIGVMAEDGETTDEYTVTFRSALATPAPTAVSESSSSIKVTWAPVANAESYKLTIGGVDYTVTDTDATGYIVSTGLTANQTYTYTLQAIGDGDIYEDSEVSASQDVRVLNNNAALSMITVGGNELSDFTSTETIYSIELPFNATLSNAIVDATKADSKADFSITQIDDFGDAAVITVYAEDRAVTATYYVTITKASQPSSDATLSSLTIGGVEVDNFDAETTSYIYTVPSSSFPESGIEIDGMKADLGATITAKVDATAFGQSSSITVKAEDNSTKTYEVLIRGTLDTPTLTTNSSTASSVTANWTVDSNAASYTVELWNADASVKLDEQEEISVGTVTFAGLSTAVTYTVKVIAVGDDNIYVNSASATTTIRTKNTDASLATLTVSAGTWDTPFASATTEYTITLPYKAVKPSVTAATTTDENAQVVTAIPAQPATWDEGDNVVTISTLAEDGETDGLYTITFVRSTPGNDATIKEFKIGEAIGVINGTTITVTIPATTDVTKLTPAVTMTDVNAECVTSGENDFTCPQTYETVAEDGTTRLAYTVVTIKHGKPYTTLYETNFSDWTNSAITSRACYTPNSSGSGINTQSFFARNITIANTFAVAAGITNPSNVAASKLVGSITRAGSTNYLQFPNMTFVDSVKVTAVVYANTTSSGREFRVFHNTNGVNCSSGSDIADGTLIGSTGDVVKVVKEITWEVPLNGIANISLKGYNSDVYLSYLKIETKLASSTPSKDLTIAGSSVCAEDQATVTLKTSQCGVQYYLHDGTNKVADSDAWGTGSDLVWNVPTENATYSIKTNAINNYSAVTLDNTATVVVKTAPALASVTATDDKVTICSNASTTLTANGAVGTIAWYKDDALLDGETENTLSVTSAGTYKAVASTGCGEDVEQSITIATNAAPALGILSENVATCASAAATTTLSLSGSTGDIQWQELVDETWTDIENETNATYAASISTASITSYRAVVSSGVCTALESDAVTVTVYAAPYATAGEDQSLEEAVGLSFTLAGNNPVGIQETATGLWTVSPLDGSTFEDATVYNTKFYPAGLGGSVYTLTWTVSNGECTPAYEEVTITVTPPTAPSVALSSAEGTDGQTVVVGEDIVDITYLYGGTATTAAVNGLDNSGLDIDVSGKTLTISGTTAKAGVYAYEVTTTPAGASIEGEIVVRLAQPAAPTVTADSRTTSGFAIEWTAVADADGYIVKLYDAEGVEIETELQTVTTTSATFSGLDEFTAYQFSVTATYAADDRVNSDESATGNVTTVNTDNKIVSFALNGIAAAEINHEAGTILVAMPRETDLSLLNITAVLPTGADSDIPASADFTDNQTYTVTSESGDDKEYTVSVIVQKAILYLTASSDAQKDNDKFLQSLKNNAKYSVTARASAGTGTIPVAYSNYDLVVLHESLGGSDASNTSNELYKIKNENIPLLNTKSYFYQSGTGTNARWAWGNAINGATAEVYMTVTKPSHPIFNQSLVTGYNPITIEDEKITLIDARVNTSKTFQPTSVTKSGSSTLATAGTDATSNIVIHELASKDRLTSGETGKGKYLLISINGSDSNPGDFKNLTTNGLNLLNNAVVYLLGKNSDASLKELTLSDGALTPAFDPETLNYTVKVAAGTTIFPTIATATANDINALSVVTASTGSQATVTVTAEDGETVTVYTVNFITDVNYVTTETGSFADINWKLNGGDEDVQITNEFGTVTLAEGANVTLSEDAYTGNTLIVMPGAKFLVEGTGSITVDEVIIYGNQPEYGDAYTFGQIEDQIDGIVAAKVSYARTFIKRDEGNKQRWYNIAIPFNVESVSALNADGSRTPMTLPADADSDGDFYMEYYDGAARASSLIFDGRNWVDNNLNSRGGIFANEGYTFAIDKDFPTTATTAVTVLFTSAEADGTATSIWSSTEKGYSVAPHASTSVGHQGWNYIGNPYSMPYKTGPVGVFYVYNEATGVYKTRTNFRASDLNLYLDPFKPLFIQAAENSVTFGAQNVSLRGLNADPIYSLALNLTNGTYSDEFYLELNQESTTAYDLGRDAQKLYSTSATVPLLFATYGGYDLSITSIPYQTGKDIEIPMSYYSPGKGSYAISYAATDASDNFEKVILKDNTGNQVNLLAGETYSIVSTKKETVKGKLTLIVSLKSDNPPTWIPQTGDADVKIKAFENQLTVTGLAAKATVKIFDISGRRIATYENVENNQPIQTSLTGVYIVRVDNETQQAKAKVILK